MSGTTDDPANPPGEQPDPPEQPDGETAAPADDDTQDPEHEQPRGYSARDRGPMDQRQTDAAWEEIVAELSDLSTDRAGDLTASPATEAGGFDFPVAPWVDQPSDEPEPQGPAAPRVHPSGHRSWVVSDEAQAAREAEGDFVPPDPDFELSADRLRNLGWFAVVAAPVLAVLAIVLWRDAPTSAYVTLVGMFLAGAALLVWRMPTHRDDDSGDGGAVV